MSPIAWSRFARRNDTRRSDTRSRDGLLCYRLLLLSDYGSRADLFLRLFVEQRLLRLIAVAQGHETQDEEEDSHEPQRRKK